MTEQGARRYGWLPTSEGQFALDRYDASKKSKMLFQGSVRLSYVLVGFVSVHVVKALGVSLTGDKICF